jgi:apolipoprotein D and lipocalin family protein
MDIRDFRDLSCWKNCLPALRRRQDNPEMDGLLVVAGATVLATAFTVALTWGWRKRVARRLHDVVPVRDFDPERFGGAWQEWAHITPRGHEAATEAAMFVSAQDDGSLHLARRRYCPEHMRWHTEEQTLRPVRTPDIAAFKSDRKGGLYGIVVLDPHYRWALMVGETVDQLWMLVRPDTRLPTRVFNQMLDEARVLGFDKSRIHVLST